MGRSATRSNRCHFGLDILVLAWGRSATGPNRPHVDLNVLVLVWGRAVTESNRRHFGLSVLFLVWERLVERSSRGLLLIRKVSMLLLIVYWATVFSIFIRCPVLLYTQSIYVHQGFFYHAQTLFLEKQKYFRLVPCLSMFWP